VQLLDPIAVGSATLSNRVVFGPHATNLGDGRAFSPRHVAYYRRRAEGGAGLIITEDASVHPLDWPYERSPLATECQAGWAEIAEAVHAAGSVCIAGLSHAGLQGSSAFSQRELWAPSHVADAGSRELPKEMEEADIQAVIAGFAEAAGIAMDSGLDGVEINAGQNSLVRQFLSGLTNLRGDQWGPASEGEATDAPGRERFALQVLQEVRASIGDGVLGLRLSCDELAPWAGITPEAAAELAATFAPLVDYLVVVRGSIFSVDATVPDTHQPEGFNLDLAQQIRSSVDGAAPVMAQGSIVAWGQAEWALTDGRADLVEMTRAQIADPDLASKLASDTDRDRIRPCLRCNQKCRVRDNRNPIVSCVMHPTTGFEETEPEGCADIKERSTADVVIVGAGPAGLECARVLAVAGHQVSIVDQRPEAGGLVRDWVVASGRDPLVAGVDWLEAECRALGVELRLSETVSGEMIAEWKATGSAVVLCTGSIAGYPSVEPSNAAPSNNVASNNAAVAPLVIDAHDTLRQLRQETLDMPEGPVLVWDPVGGPIAISIAETLAPHRSIIFVTPDITAGTQLSLTGDLAAATARLHQAEVDIIRRHEIASIPGGDADGLGAIELRDRFTGTIHTVEAAVVIDCATRLPNDELWRATDMTLPRAGDVVAPRTMYEAILEGRRTAIELHDG